MTDPRPAPPSADDPRMPERASRDPFYRSLLAKGASVQELFAAGLFVDTLESPANEHPSWDVTLQSTPVGKLIDFARFSRGSTKPLVLLSTGSFSPVHRDHLTLMERAKEVLEARGHRVLAGYLSPSHDQYVSQKQGGQAALHAEHRIALLEEAVADSDWLSVCSWEARHAPAALNFTDVLLRLQAYLQAQTQLDVEVVYVFGEDNAAFMHAFAERGRAVCVQRGVDWHPFTLQTHASVRAEATQEQGNSSDERVLLAPRAVYRVSSSTAVRAGDSELIPEASRARYEAIRGREKPVPRTYLLRDDLEHACAHWPLVDAAARAEFVAELWALLQWALEPTGATVRTLTLSAQREAMRRIQARGPTLSLDACVPADFNLSVCRRFDMGDGQVRSHVLVPRPGTPELRAQVANLPRVPWTVVDDDKASGQTERAVLALLTGAGHRVRGFEYLNEHVLPSLGVDKTDVLDIVDARDFLVDAQDGGLVVRLPDGSLERRPYMLPHVNPVFRAKLPAERIGCFSREMWALNARWHAKYTSFRSD